MNVTTCNVRLNYKQWEAHLQSMLYRFHEAESHLLSMRCNDGLHGGRLLKHYSRMTNSNFIRRNNEKTVKKAIGWNNWKSQHQSPALFSCNQYCRLINPKHEEYLSSTGWFHWQLFTAKIIICREATRMRSYCSPHVWMLFTSINPQTMSLLYKRQLTAHQCCTATKW